MPRPYTLQDIIKGLQAQLDALRNPLPSGPTLLDATLVSDEGFNTADSSTVSPRSSLGVWAPDPLTLSGNEITDAVRTLNVQGDGRTPPAGIGMWEQSTDLCTNGGAETNLAGHAGVQGTETLTRDSAFPKFGSWAVKTVTPGSVPVEGPKWGTWSATLGQTYTVSVWARVASGTQVCRLRVTSPTAAVEATTNVTLTTTYQRFTLTFTSTVTEAHTLSLVTDTAAAVTIYSDGYQIEQKAYATPYIHTDGATATRAAARAQAPSSLLNATQGWFAARVRMGWSSSSAASINGGANTPICFYSDGSTANYLWLHVDTSARFGIEDGKGGLAHTSAQTWNAGDVFTVVGYYTSTQVAISLNGAAFIVAARTGSSTGLNTFDLGTLLNSRWVDSSILWFACGTGTLTDADAATLYALGNTPPTWATLPPSAAPTMIWSCVDATTTGSGWGLTQFS